MGFPEPEDADRREVGMEMAGHLQYDPADRMWNAVQWSSLGTRCDLIARMGASGNSRQASGSLPTSLGTGGRSRHLPDRGSDREYRSQIIRLGRQTHAGVWVIKTCRSDQ